MGELQIIVNQEVGKIDSNFQEVKAMLAKEMSFRKSEVFTEDSKKFAKSEVATLRKLKKAIDDKKKEVKTQCLLPYVEFEAKAIELMELIDEPILLINKQVEEFEQKRKQGKRKQIRELYEKSVGDIIDYLPLEKIYDARWENSTTTLKAVGKEIEAFVSGTRTAVDTIKGMVSDATEEALKMYKTTLNMPEAIAYINAYEKQKADILKREEEKRREEEERKKQEEIDRIRREERQRVEEENRIREEEKRKLNPFHDMPTLWEAPEDSLFECEEEPFSTQEPEEEPGLPFVQPSTLRVLYAVVGTPEELEEMEMMLSSIGIYFERKGE